MLAKDRARAEGMAHVLAEDIADAMGIPWEKLDQTWRDFAEAVGLFVFASGKMERIATTGALVYTAAQLP